MQITRSLAFSTIRGRYEDCRQALEAHDKDLPTSGPVPQHLIDREKRLDDAEYAALQDLLLAPCLTPLDLADKLRIVDARDVQGWDVYPQVKERIAADLISMTRPDPSPEMALAFSLFADAHRAVIDELGGDEAAVDALVEVENQRELAILKVPCTTPGDFMVKAFIGLLSAASRYDDDFVFLPTYAGETKYLEEEVERAMLADLLGSDLGLCMALLGKIDFDPREWLERATSAGLQVYVGGCGGLYMGEPVGDVAERGPGLRHLRNLLGGERGNDRAAAVRDLIRAEFPFLAVSPVTAKPQQLAEAA